ncbi:MAG TPA: hypothetical protein RMH99_14870, partial [Sandaracinaceae bacterium LLY-WYZ-13_1]|nr:hypothetical protein [Sandaracinaceae bacterium LLY-WYZ-13_1]
PATGGTPRAAGPSVPGSTPLSQAPPTPGSGPGRGASAHGTAAFAPRASGSAPTLRGGPTPMRGRGPFAVVEALLKSPASLLHEVQRGRSILFSLSALVVVTMILTGLVMAAFSGGLQLLWVPVKLSLGVFFCALITLPSLYIFSCLAGAEQSLRETFGAMLMGVALMGVLLVGFAPVSWVFSQATSSAAFMGGLHLLFLVISSVFGVGLIGRALSAANGRTLRGTALWGVLFVLVLFQMSTTLRPLIGDFDGVALHGKQFFLAHWVETLS